MTPEERARDIGWCTCMARNDKMPRSHDEHCIATQISDAIRAAVEAENEACAKTAETMLMFAAPKDVAAAIRARTEGGQG